LIIAGQLDINGVDLFTHINQPFEGSCPDQTDRGQCRFAEELMFRVTQGRYGIIMGSVVGTSVGSSPVEQGEVIEELWVRLWDQGHQHVGQ